MKTPEQKQLDADLLKAKMTGRSLGEIRREKGLPVAISLSEETAALRKARAARLKLARENRLIAQVAEKEVKSTKVYNHIHYDLDFNKPRGNRKRAPEVVRIWKSYFKGPMVKYFKTLVISEDGSVYSRSKDNKSYECSAPFDWTRAWTCVGHVGADGINAFLEVKYNEGWHCNDPKYAGSRSHYIPVSEQTDEEKPVKKLKPRSILDLIRIRQVQQNKKLNKLEDKET